MDYNRRTPLNLAERNGHGTVVEALAAKGGRRGERFAYVPSLD